MNPWPNPDAYWTDLFEDLDNQGIVNQFLEEQRWTRQEAEAKAKLGAATKLIFDHWRVNAGPHFEGAMPWTVDDQTFELLKPWRRAQLDVHQLGRSLVLAGPVGTGKTHTAIAIASDIAARRQSWATYHSVVRMLRALGPTGDLELAQFWHHELLILDDLGAHKPSEWATSQLEDLLDYRWTHGLATVATTNLTPGRLEQSIGERAYSRLMHEATAIQLVGEDRRRAA